ncbi:MAG TPA: acetyl-CoA C-acyltransferase [Pirellulales bacterium]|jgi:acetyl-CoA acyltransferase|nr:acetyl-CoA C-acyltransferase [Pirellulales bacterium]
MSKTPVIVAAARTAIGRSHKEKGVFRDVRADDLAVAVLRALVERSQIDPLEIEDVLLGNTQQQGEQGMNVARTAAIMAGLPLTAGGTTINRLCGSSLQALNQASHAIVAGAEDVQIVGGLEHMQHYPMDLGVDLNPKLFERTSKGALMMGVTAEFLAQTGGISRLEQDEFALRSHQRAAAAFAAGQFRPEIVPVWGRDEAGQRILVERDQCVRPDASLAALAKLEPAFMPGLGTVTAGNSSPLNDGAAALLIMSEEKAHALGLKPLVKVRATAVVGVEPAVMGTGPIPATKKALARAGLSLADIDLIELNEAFAAQALTCVRALELDLEKVNVRGGAIAIGHPLGASGARIATTLIHAMIDQQANLGLATMCIGVGQGIATVFERC